MSDSDSGAQNHNGRESRSASRIGSTQKSDKSAACSYARFPSEENSILSAVKSQSKLKSKSRSQISSPRPYTPTQSRPYTPTQSRPYTPTQSRPYMPTQSRPYTPTQSRPYMPTQSRPYTPTQSRPYTPTQSRPYTPTQSRPYTPTQSRPYTPMQSRPYTPTQSRPYTPTQSRPYTPTQSRPYTPRQSGSHSRSKTCFCSCFLTRSRPRSRSLPRFRSLTRSRSLPRSPPCSRTRRQSQSPSYSRDYRDYRDYCDYRRSYGYNYSPPAPPRHQWGNQYSPEPNSCLGIFGLSLFTTERDLREIFTRYGPISDVSIVYDQQSRRSRGFAFVYFENVHDAREAREIVDGMELDGRRIRVDFSITKRPHAPTPGVYMGRSIYGRHIDYYDREYDRRYGDWDYYSQFYRGGGGVLAAESGEGWRNGQDSYYFYRRRSPTPYHSQRRYRSPSCSRSRLYSPRRF